MATLDERIAELRRQGKSVAEICAEVDRSSSTVGRCLQRLGLTKSPTRTDIKADDVERMYDDGFTIVEIAKHYDTSHDVITRRLAEKGITCDRTTGILRHFERVHEEKWPEIKKDLDNGMSLKEAAAVHNMRYENIERLMDKHDYVRGENKD